MAGKRTERPVRRMKKVFLVLCEGETEEAYVNLLRSRFRIPIKVVPKVAGSDISNRKLEHYKKELRISATDAITTFLMYDMDVPAVVERLNSLDAEAILSNPCIELWFLLHSSEIHSAVKSDDCLRKLMSTSAIWNNYKKGLLSLRQQELLWEHKDTACMRAKCLAILANPSSNMYILIEKLKGAANG